MHSARSNHKLIIIGAKSWFPTWKKALDDKICDAEQKESSWYDKIWEIYVALNDKKCSVKIHNAEFYSLFYVRHANKPQGHTSRCKIRAWGLKQKCQKRNLWHRAERITLFQMARNNGLITLYWKFQLISVHTFKCEP